MDIQHELTDTERAVIAERLLLEQRVRFNGIQKAAYVAAGINPTTWKRAVMGASVKPYTLVAIVRALWPESGGDWNAVPDSPATTTNHQGPTWIGGNGEPWGPDLTLVKDYIDERADDLEGRVRELEKIVLGLTPANKPTTRPAGKKELIEGHVPDVASQRANSPTRPSRRRTGQS